MEAGLMEGLCIELLKLELLLVEYVLKVQRAILDDATATPAIRDNSRQLADDLTKIVNQLREVFHGQYCYHEKYPEDRYLTKYWWESVILAYELRRTGNLETAQSAQESLHNIENQAVIFQNQLIRTAGLIEIPRDVRSAIQHKWVKLVDGLEMHDQLFNTSMRCQTWYASADY